MSIKDSGQRSYNRGIRTPERMGDMRGCCLKQWITGAVLLLLPSLLLSENAAAQVTDQQAKRQVEDSFDVEVLRVRGSEIDNRAVWLVTFMVPPGDSNAAFMVSSLAIDRQTGDLVPVFRHRESGYELPGGLRSDRTGMRPEAARTGTWR